MTVTTQNASYEANAAKWQRCRDAIEGKDAILRHDLAGFNAYSSAIKISGALSYLPPLSDQTVAEYAKFSLRAPYFNAADRTVNALSGMIFAKDPMWALPAAINSYADDITLSGDSLRSFAYHVTEEEISTSRVGVLVDYPQASPAGMSMADAQRLNLRPFLRMYKAESIINWREAVINGARKLVMVVLCESVETAGDSEFEVGSANQYRVLDLFEGRYRQRLLNEKDELISEVFPFMRGAPMTEIPFRIVGGTTVRKPLLMDLVDVSFDHYRRGADLVNGEHYTALPTPWVAGVHLDEGKTLNIGSTTAWTFDNHEAKVGYLEFTGAGLGSIKSSLTDLERQMAVLGARMLSEDTRGAEAVGTMELRTASERSILAAVARDVSDCLRQCLDWMAQWVGAQPNTEFALNTDYGVHTMTPEKMRALREALNDGSITLETFFEQMQKGEIISPDAEYEAYAQQLADAGPRLEQP